MMPEGDFDQHAYDFSTLHLGLDSSYKAVAGAEIHMLGTIAIISFCRHWGEVYTFRRALHRVCA